MAAFGMTSKARASDRASCVRQSSGWSRKALSTTAKVFGHEVGVASSTGSAGAAGP
jgi:hypothetical protein